MMPPIVEQLRTFYSASGPASDLMHEAAGTIEGLVDELHIVAHALDRALHATGRDHDDASWWKWGADAWARSQAFLAKLRAS